MDRKPHRARTARARPRHAARRGARLLALCSALALPASVAVAAEEEPPEASGRAAPAAEGEAAAEPAADAPEKQKVTLDLDIEAPDLSYVEPASEGVEQITVKAERRDRLIQEVPISMVALDSSFLEATGLTQFGRLQDFVPNLRITPATDSRSTSIRIRGIGSTGVNAGVDPSVGVFIDGVYQGRAGMSVSDFLDIERVEVLRGPQGTLYGKNTAAGAINVFSKRPGPDFEINSETVFGDYDLFEQRASVNIPILEERMAARFAGYWKSRDGLDENRFDGSIVNDNLRWGLRGRVGLDVTESLSLLVSGDFARTDNECCYPDIISYNGPPSIPGISPAFDAPPPSPLPTGPGAFAAPPPPPQPRAGVRGPGPSDPGWGPHPPPRPPTDPFSVLPVPDAFDRVIGANRTTRDRVDVGGVSLELDAQIPNHGLTWLTAWRTYQTDSIFDGDFSVYDGSELDTEADLDQVSSELRIASDAWERFDYQGGLYFYWQQQDTVDSNTLQPEYLSLAPLLQAVNTANGNPPLTPLENVGDNTHETLTGALYGDGTFHISEKWSVTGGVRGTYERKTRVGSQTSSAPALGDIPPLIGPDVSKDEERTAWNATGRAILRFHPTQDAMIYASFATGFKSGGFNQLRTAAGVPSEFDDETSLNYELGARTSWFDRRLTLNLTGFYTDYQDFQALSFDGSTISIRNAGSLESYGVELELMALPFPGLSLGSRSGWNVADYTDFDTGECTVAQINQVPFGTPCFQDLTGERLDNAPRWSVSSFIQYEHPFALHRWPVVAYARADHSFTSEYFLAQDLDPNLLQDGYHVVDLRMGLRTDDGRVDLSFWVRNANDADYQIVGFDVPAVNGYASINGPQRQVGGTIRLRY